MPPFIQYIQNEQHFTKVLQQALLVRSELWIGTADIKDLFIKDGSNSIPFLGLLSKLVARKVIVRLLHAKEPGPLFRKDFDKYPNLATGLERAICPRVHFKIFIFDMETAYVGSANLTGAGIGMKSPSRRNFEAGILTNDPEIVESAINQFDTVWRGEHCKKCDRKEYCGDRLDG
ncbi:phospholipase D-like domain-containing protein [Perlabentimonas gracilis]|uniref:phospholipase D-like domain-containing protein n=1 Tax=Perlabentimonas gracilis TaxID=2715279 RepID=UPI00140915B9|nr:phospholipase D-like domain-containing protein [Perlabentimonas gracilis]NHB67314.1 phospholipase [Perlabentimonas gracilis]